MESSKNKLTANISRRGFLMGAAASTTGAIVAVTIPHNREMVKDLMDELVDVQGDRIDKFLGVGRDGDG